MQMMEIIPNWHPIFVHFTVALTSIATFFFCLGFVLQNINFGKELLVAGRLCLWAGALAAIATVTAGFIAYYTVSHDTPSHEAMIIHRNWALTTLSVVLITAIWSIYIWLKNKTIGVFFLLAMVSAFLLVTITAWHGAELVYRYGLGVQSLPKESHAGHAHHLKAKENHDSDSGHDHNH